MDASSLDSPHSDPPITIGKRALESAFQKLLEQFGGRSENGVSFDIPQGVPQGGIDRLNREVNDSNREIGANSHVNCCCRERSRDDTEMPTFSLSYSNAPTCSVNGRNAAQSTHHSPCKTAGKNKRILEIHLPESSKDPCQILITSNRDQVSVKYIKQGQQFTFSTSSSCDETVRGTPTREIPNEVFSSAENVSFATSTGRDSLEASPKRKKDLVNGDVPENLDDDNSFLPSRLTTDNSNDSSCSDLPAAKKQKKQSLNTFINSLLNKRTREESRRGMDSATVNIDSESEQEGTPFDLQETEDANGIGDSSDTPRFVTESYNEPPSSIFASESFSEANHSAAASQPPRVSSNARFAKPAVPGVKAAVKRGRFKCQYCSELFEQRSDCLIHISHRHVEERPHHCPLCDATFKKRRSLKYHLRHHNGERPFKCTYCDKAFKEKYHLTVHIRTHTGERPFACTQCGKAFKQTNELTSHIRTHTGERPYKCNLCDKWFKRRRQLYSHNLSHISSSAIASVQENDIGMVSSDVISTEMASTEEKPLEVIPLEVLPLEGAIQ